jgi:arsenite-transporting ATPase
VLSQLAGLPMPPDKVFAAVERLHEELSEVRALLVDPATTSVRLVLTPEAVVVAEARRTLTSLSLYGYRVDGVVANRVIPAGSDDPWMQGWVAAQREQLDGIATSFGTTPVWTSTYQPGEPVGVEPLAALAAQMYAGVDPLAVNDTEDPLVVERVSTDEFVLSVALPHADKRTVDLVRKGDELVLTVGSHRRVLALPSVLRRCLVDGAALRDGALRVRFRPDPDVWMRP